MANPVSATYSRLQEEKTSPPTYQLMKMCAIYLKDNLEPILIDFGPKGIECECEDHFFQKRKGYCEHILHILKRPPHIKDFEAVKHDIEYEQSTKTKEGTAGQGGGTQEETNLYDIITT